MVKDCTLSRVLVAETCIPTKSTHARAFEPVCIPISYKLPYDSRRLQSFEPVYIMYDELFPCLSVVLHNIGDYINAKIVKLHKKIQEPLESIIFHSAVVIMQCYGLIKH